MPTTSASGTEAVIVNTPSTLATISTEGVFVLNIDTTNMVGGDDLEITVETKVLTGGTSRQVYSAMYSNAQSDAIKISVPVSSMFEYVAKINQVSGTARSYAWSILGL